MPLDRDAQEEAARLLEAASRKHVRMATRMALEHSDTLRYVYRAGWHVWREGCWVPDPLDAPTLAVLATRAQAMVELASLSGTAADELYSDARMLDTATNIQGVVKIAKALPVFAVALEDLDPDPYALNTPDGVYDLRTGTLREHDPAVLHTKMTGTSAVGARSGGPWSEFLTQVLPDEEARAYTQKVCGYSLQGKVADQVMPILTGEGGTGKSTFLNVIMAAVGTYGGVATSTLLVSTGNRTEHPTEVARLRGLRLVVAHETEKGQALKTATVKEMTGGDRLKGRFMREDFFEFTPSHTFVMVTNFPPTLDADDGAAWDRIRVVPFTTKFRGTERENTNLAAQIIASDLPAVMRWLLDGYALYVDEGLTPPPAVQAATAAYHDEVDTFSQFLRECTERVEAEETALADLTRRWQAWARTQNVPPGRPNDMRQRLADRGIDAGLGATGRTIYAYGIKMVDNGFQWAL